MTYCFCNKRYDISFIDFYKFIKLCLPNDYIAKDSRGIYRTDYQPCNIITIENRTNPEINKEYIYCWLGQKGLTVLANTELAMSLCLEVLKNVKQNPEDYKVLNYTLSNYDIDIDEFFNNNPIVQEQDLKNNYLIYQMTNNRDNTNKFLIREYNGDEVEMNLYRNPDSLRLSGAITSLFTYVQLIIERNLNSKSE